MNALAPTRKPMSWLERVVSALALALGAVVKGTISAIGSYDIPRDGITSSESFLDERRAWHAWRPDTPLPVGWRGRTTNLSDLRETEIVSLGSADFVAPTLEVEAHTWSGEAIPVEADRCYVGDCFSTTYEFSRDDEHRYFLTLDLSVSGSDPTQPWSVRIAEVVGGGELVEAGTRVGNSDGTHRLSASFANPRDDYCFDRVLSAALGDEMMRDRRCIPGGAVTLTPSIELVAACEAPPVGYEAEWCAAHSEDQACAASGDANGCSTASEDQACVASGDASRASLQATPADVRPPESGLPKAGSRSSACCSARAWLGSACVSDVRQNSRNRVFRSFRSPVASR